MTPWLREVALGERPAELVVRDARLVNVYTGEILPAWGLAAAGGRIAYVGPEPDFAIGQGTEVIEGDGRYLVPGLIEAHTHLVWRFSIERYVPFALRGGTTAAISEGIELASVLGEEGFRLALESFRGQPMRLYLTLPPLAGTAAFVEDVRIPLERARAYLADPQVVGVGEVYWANLMRSDAYLDALIELAREAGKTVEGHAAGARGRKLQAYLGAGIEADHEPVTAEEAIERLRLGAWVMARHGAVRQDLPELARAWRAGLDARRLILCTDSVSPQTLLEEGALNALLSEAVGLGLPPAVAVQALSLNVAERFRLDRDIGGLAPGRRADFSMAAAFDPFRPDLVVFDGRLAARDGQVLLEPRPVRYPQTAHRSVCLPPLTEADFAPPPPGRYRAMRLETHLVTREAEVALRDGLPPDTLLCSAIERVRGAGERFHGLLQGLGLRDGAAGTTLSWDSPCLVVVGDRPAEMLRVARHLEEVGGGTAVAAGGRILAAYHAPVGGVLSQAPLPVVVAEERAVNAAMRTLGSQGPDPGLTLAVLTAAAIPFLRITQRGYVRLRTGEIVGLRS